MAIIERKQLTGTTEQINAYAGHNGQLAFDKTTKHLHVLSGTAGASTKLANVSDIPAPVDISGKADKTEVALKANKAYVDTELAKKQATGDYATNTALTTGLAGKANISDIPDVSSFATTKELDKYLPLSGGDLKGILKFRSLATIDANTSSDYNGLEVRSSTTREGGAAMYLRSNEATGAREAGSWGITSKDSNMVEHALQGIEGNLYYDGAEVVRQSSTSTFGPPVGGYGIEWRFSSGLMIIVGGAFLTEGASETVTFKTPFTSYDYGVGVAYTTANRMRITSAQKTYITFMSLDSSSAVNLSFIIMGSWK